MNAQLEYLKLPPHSVESEQAVLGGLLIDNSALDRIADLLTVADLYRQEHRLIFKAVSSLVGQSKPADVVTVAEKLQEAGTLDAAGGLSYLVELTNNTPSAANIRRYAEIVRERAVFRKLVEIGGRMADAAYAPGGKSSNDLLGEIQQDLSELETSNTNTEAQSIADALRVMVERIDRTFHGEIKQTKTGFKDLDEKLIGLESGDMIVIAGRPSMGKTALALQIAEHVSETEPSLIFSMEMPAMQLAMRQVSSTGNIDLLKLRSANMDHEDWTKLTYAIGKLRERNLFIDDRSGLNMQQVRARARQVKRKHGLGLIVLDYLQLVAGDGENRNNAVSEISRQIKGMARELDVPVICLSQLSRKVEERQNKRPTMADLRDSGAIEQDADVVLMLYRDEYYFPESQWKGIAECIIGKQRNGPVGMVPLTYIAERAMFGDFCGHYEPDRKQLASRGFS